MPFKSKAQRRKFAQLLVEGKISDETYEEWNRSTGRKELPERVTPAQEAEDCKEAQGAQGEEGETGQAEIESDQDACPAPHRRASRSPERGTLMV